MRKNLSIVASVLLGFALQPSLMAKGGDPIRDIAPMTALILDARDNYSAPLKEAFFKDDIDFFLDFERSQTRIVQELYNIREAGRAIEANDYTTADQRIRAIQGYNDVKQYLRAVLDAAQGRYQQSLEGFRQLIDRRSELDSRLKNLAFMGAARVFHEIQDYKQAIYHYNQVRQLDSEFFQSVFEKSWSFYLNGDMNGALGGTLTFLSPYFESAFYPEAMVVRTASFFQLCYFDRATATAAATKREWEPVGRQIRELMNRDPRSWLFDERIVKGVNKRILGFMISDSRFRTAMRARLGLEKEVKRLGNRPEASLASQALASVKNRLIAEAQRVLRSADKQVTDVLSQMEIVAIEILQASANQILGVSPEEQAKVKIIDLGDVDFDRMVQFWPFKGEFWVDELGSYYYGLKSKCELGSTSKNAVNSILYAAASRHSKIQKVW